MNDLWKLAPDFTDFQATTDKEAVTLFHRTTADWSIPQWDNLPELLVKLDQNLTGSELDMFEMWIQYPKGGVDVATQTDDEKELMSSGKTTACTSTSHRA